MPRKSSLQLSIAIWIDWLEFPCTRVAGKGSAGRGIDQMLPAVIMRQYGSERNIGNRTGVDFGIAGIAGLGAYGPA